MSQECLNSGECRQYCNVLDSLAENRTADDCSWPEQFAAGYDYGNTTNPELAQATAHHLLRLLSAGNRVQKQMAEAGSELNVALSTYSTIFDAQSSLWQKYAEAARSDRVITDVEVSFYTEKLTTSTANAVDGIRQAGVGTEVLTFAQAIHDRQTLEEHGLLFDETMLQTVTHLCANASSGQSTLLIGEKGIAKTQAAKFVSALFSPDGKPKFISGDGSMMKDEFIGKMTLTEQNGATVTTFHPGILTECMKEGIPFVIDEVNLIDPAIAMRLQDILLRKPGDTINIQEDDGAPVKIKHGFIVIATANEANSRYQSRAALDPAFRDRFTVLPVEYPDGDTIMLQAADRPASLARLAYAFAVSPNGVANKHVSPRDAMWLASIAHASQQLYSKPAKDVKTGQLGNKIADVIDNDEPRMSDCITPRKMVGILQTIARGLNPYDKASGVQGLAMDTIAAMQRTEDRLTMFEVIRLMHDGSTGTFDEAGIKKRLRV